MIDSKLQHIKNYLATKGEPAFRFQQVETAWYTQAGWDAVTTLSKELREDLAKQFPWLTVESSKIVMTSGS